MLRQAANDVMLRINDVGLRSVARHKADLFNDVALRYDIFAPQIRGTDFISQGTRNQKCDIITERCQKL